MGVSILPKLTAMVCRTTTGTILPFCLRPAHPQNDKRKGYEGDECHVNGHQHTGEEAEQNRPGQGSAAISPALAQKRLNNALEHATLLQSIYNAHQAEQDGQGS